MLRFNSQLGKAEIYNGSAWEEVGTGSGSVTELSQTIAVSGQSSVVAPYSN